jgi:hypothetical protein
MTDTLIEKLEVEQLTKTPKLVSQEPVSQSSDTLNQSAYEQAEITFTAVSLSCGETGKWPLKEAIRAYFDALFSEIGLPDDEVERVAIAICPWYGKGVSTQAVLSVWEHLGPDKKEAYRAQARAAIIVLREPKQKMGNRWRPIETAVRDEKADAILLYGNGSYAVCTWYAPVEKWMFCQTGNKFVFFDGATHWQPLPEIEGGQS